MGDRANVVFQFHDGGEVFLYTHWNGSELPEILAAALDRGRDRWQDESYLCRIVFSEMTKGNETSLTGYGIAPYPPDNEHPYLVVDCEAMKVKVMPWNWWPTWNWWPNGLALDPLGEWSFEEWVAAKGQLVPTF